MKKCEICGAVAEYGVQDTKRFDNLITNIVERIRDGEPHYFCSVHKRDSIETFGGVIYTQEEQDRVRGMNERPTKRPPDAGDSSQ